MTHEARLIQGVAPHGNGFHLNDRIVALRSVSTRVFAEGRLRLALLRQNFALEYDLGMRRHFQIQSAARHQLHRLAHNSAGD